MTWYDEDDEIDTPYKDKAEELRNQLINDCIIPQIKGVFQKYKEIKSAILMVAQYWNDEAHDAVHQTIIYSELEEPDLLAAEKFEEEDKPDVINLPSIKNEYNSYDYYLRADGNYKYWDDNNMAIPAFACYCNEYCHQEMNTFEAYSPYALFKKSENNEISMKIIGVKIRPWLEGVIPDWEKDKE